MLLFPFQCSGAVPGSVGERESEEGGVCKQTAV